VAGFLATIVTAGALYMTYREVSRLQFVYIFVVTLGLLLAHRALLRISYRFVGKARPGSQGRVLIVGAGDLGQRVAQVILDHSRWGYSLVGFLDDDEGKQGDTYEGAKVLGKIFEVKECVAKRKADEVWIALPVWALDRLNLVINELEKLPVRIKVVPDYFSLAMVQAKAEILGGIPIIGLREPVIEGLPRLLKRGFDLVVGSLLLLLAAPPMLVIAIAIRLDSSGHVIFGQERVGENGRLFGMYKFRTMVADAETQQDLVNIQTEDDEVLHKRPDDPRVTKVGHFLRRYSLDELPQLVNVIRGDMSLVGPRPEMPWLVDRYESWQRKRFAVPQGITGWWQINGRSDKPMHMNPEDDLYYVYNYSLWLDIQILLRTPLAVLQGRGAF
jgi:exopolysaccharide biosynthesis polyprenyl glycosylphosphotransferase